MKLSDEVMENVEQSKEKIGELLVKHTSLTRPQLEEALQKHSHNS